MKFYGEKAQLLKSKAEENASLKNFQLSLEIIFPWFFIFSKNTIF